MKKYGFLLFLLLLTFWIGGCGHKYDYTIHKPKVQYKKPDRKALSRILQKQLGKPYIWAEEGPDAFDCSGLVYYSYASMNMQDIPRVARRQAKVGKKVPVDQLKYGDLIFFDTTPRKTGQITHVGIYIGDGKFEHASNEKEGVKISSLSKPYYRSRVRICRRWLPEEPVEGAAAFKPLKPIRLASASKTECKKCYSLPQKVTAKSGDWFIQVGSFRGIPDPNWLAHITALGYDYHSVRGEDGMKKLLVGPFVSREDALEVLPNARHEFNPGAFIKHMPKG
ncbi:NlpC/P60 family protein [Nitratifractor sp.]